MKKLTLSVTVSLLFLSVLAVSNGTLAATYYEGKTIRIIVGTTPGGGMDRMARLLVRHLPKHIPGKPTLIIENMAGADGMVAANHVYNIAKPDGLTIGTYQRGLPIGQLLKEEGVRFDITKYSWIGSSAVEVLVFCIRSDLPYKNFDDLRKAKDPIYTVGAGPGNILTQLIPIYNEFLKLNLKNVFYPSSAEGMLALERKEVDAMIATYSSLRPLIERRVVIPLIRGRVAEPGTENLLMNEDLTTDKKGKTIMSMMSNLDKLGRPYMCPPGTPAGVMSILRNAFAQVAKDAELQEEAKKVRMTADYISAEECLKVLDNFFNQPEDILGDFKKLMRTLR